MREFFLDATIVLKQLLNKTSNDYSQEELNKINPRTNYKKKGRRVSAVMVNIIGNSYKGNLSCTKKLSNESNLTFWIRLYKEARKIEINSPHLLPYTTMMLTSCEFFENTKISVHQA